MASEKGNYYMSSLVRKLRSSSASTAQKALISLTRATKKFDNVAKFREEGGLKILLQFIQTSNRKTVDMSVSVLANCALEKESRVEITNLKGLTYLYNILISLNEASILSRVTRAFANLSLDQATAQEVVDLDVIPKLVHLLKETKDSQFQQNIIRALRILGKSDDAKKELVHCNGVQFITELLQSEDKDVKTCCLQSLQDLSKTGNRQVAEQIQEHCAIEAVIELTYFNDSKIRENAVLTLSNITRNASVRVSVGTIGGIEAFIHQIKKRTARNLVLASIEGICMCCREAVNRNKVRSGGGLEVLMEVLHCPEYSQAHDMILGAFVCFSYDELALNRLIANGIVAALVPFMRKLLFPRAVEKVSDNHEWQSSTVSLEKDAVTDIDRVDQNSVKFSVTSPLSQSTVRTLSFKSKIHSVLSESRAESPLPLDITQSSVLSPPTTLSPNCSPDLHLSYMSPVYPQSVHDSIPSPMVYSPSGSEAEDDNSSSDESHVEEHHDNEKGFLETECLNLSGSINVSLSTDRPPSTSNDVYPHGQEFCDISVNTVSSFSPEMSTPLPTIPLLPGAAVSDHLYMFLPKENLFSADQPSPKKSKSPAILRNCRVRRSLSRTTPSSSPEGTNSVPTSPVNSLPSSPYSSELQGPEKKILFLLSRFGQMPNPTDALITPCCIQTLLDYLSFSLKPDPRCVRLLTRLTWDINCFEALVLLMVPGAFYRQLECGLGPRYHAGILSEDYNVKLDPIEQSSNLSPRTPDVGMSKDLSKSELVESEDLTRSIDTFNSKTTSVLTLPSESPKSGYLTNSNDPSTSEEPLGTQASQMDPGAEAMELSSSKGTYRLHNNGMQSAISSGASSQGEKGSTNDVAEDELTDDFSISPSHTSEIGKSLISVMSTQACTSFGEGQLAHLLLRGSKKQKRACALSLPYLCRSMRLKRKLLLEYNGLLMILSILSDPIEEDDVVRAIEAFTYLISNSSITLPELSSELFIGNGLLATAHYHSDNTPLDTSRKVSSVRVVVGLVPGRKSKGLTTSLANEPVALPTVLEDTGGKRRKLDICESKKKVYSGCCVYSETRTTPCDVVLKLDNGESIEASRSVLSSLSEVFSAMLSNDYVEASQREVFVKHIDYTVLMFVVHYAYGCQWYFNPDSSTPYLCTFFKKCLTSNFDELNVDFLNDLLICADRFLLDQLKEQCVQLLLSCVNEKRVTDLYLFGACYNAPVLRDFSVKYMFLGSLNLRCVYQSARRLLESEERDNMLEDLKRITLSCF